MQDLAIFKVRLNGGQIENVLDELVPMVAAPGDEAVIRFMLREVAQSGTASEFAKFLDALFAKLK